MPEARMAMYATEPGLHRSYVIADGPIGTPIFAVLLADSARSSTHMVPLSDLETLTGGTRLSGLESGETLSYVLPEAKTSIGMTAKASAVVVIDYPEAARIMISGRQGVPLDKIIEFLKAVDLRELLQF